MVKHSCDICQKEIKGTSFRNTYYACSAWQRLDELCWDCNNRILNMYHDVTKKIFEIKS